MAEAISGRSDNVVLCLPSVPEWGGENISPRYRMTADRRTARLTILHARKALANRMPQDAKLPKQFIQIVEKILAEVSRSDLVVRLVESRAARVKVSQK